MEDLNAIPKRQEDLKKDLSSQLEPMPILTDEDIERKEQEDYETRLAYRSIGYGGWNTP